MGVRCTCGRGNEPKKPTTTLFFNSTAPAPCPDDAADALGRDEVRAVEVLPVELVVQVQGPQVRARLFEFESAAPLAC